MTSYCIIKDDPTIKQKYADLPNMTLGDDGEPFRLAGKLAPKEDREVTWRECGVCAVPHTEQRKGSREYHNVLESSFYSRRQYREHLRDIHSFAIQVGVSQ